MSWVDKELKRRSVAGKHHVAGSGFAPRQSADASRIMALWGRLDAANEALPPELALRSDPLFSQDMTVDGPAFVKWLVAPNKAAIGFNGDAIRYVWPQQNLRKSNNFWIRWDGERGYLMQRRIGPTLTATDSEVLPFDERRVDDMIKWLVVGQRITTRSLRVRRFWFF